MGLVSRQVSQLVRGADPSDIDAWWDRSEPAFVRLVQRSFTVARTVTGRYLRQHAAIEGYRVAPAVPGLPVEQVAAALRVTGPVAFKRHMRISDSETAALRTMESTLTGSAERLALEGDRETFSETFQRSRVIVGYRRVARPGACSFCLALASRGAVYKSERTAQRVVGRSGRPRGARDIGASYHDHCRCFASPLYDYEEEPQEVLALRERWQEATAGHSGTAALRAFRRAMEGRDGSSQPAGT